ncbi:MAG: hypothetical protein ACFFFO_17635 [Candidatus Thorarchaeota archaeon]
MPEQIPRDEPTIVTGDRLVDDGSYKLVAEVDDKIMQYYPSVTPFIYLLKKAKANGRQQVENYKYEHLEEDQYPRDLTVASTAAAGGTSITVETGDYLKAAKNYLYMNTRTREHVILTEDPSSDTLANVTRAIGGGGAAMDVGDTLTFIAPVHPEADVMGTIKTIKETRLYNYAEIIRTPVGWSGRTANTRYYGGREPARLRARAMFEHRKSQELSLLFGRRHSETVSTSKGNRLRTFTGGAEYWIKSNVWDLNGQPLTYRALVDWMAFSMELGDSGNNNGPGVKWLIVGRDLATEIESFMWDKIRYKPLSDKIGVRAGSFTCTNGTLNIMVHPLFKGEHAGWGFLFDMKHMWYVHYRNRDSQILKNRQDPSYDGYEEEIMTDFGLKMGLEAAHGLVKL